MSRKGVWLVILILVNSCSQDKSSTTGGLTYSLPPDSIGQCPRPSRLKSGLVYPTSMHFSEVSFSEGKTLDEDQKRYLDEYVKNKEGEFENDSSYYILFVRTYGIGSQDTLFHVHGLFLPSTSEFHYFGGYNEKDRHDDIYHLPIETTLSFTRYEYIGKNIQVYGELNNENLDGKGEVLLFQFGH